MKAYKKIKIGAEEDNLIAIYQSCCFGWLSEKYTRRVMLFQCLTFQLIPVLAHIEYFNNGSFYANRNHYPNIIVMQMGSFMYLVALVGLSDIRISPEIVKMHTWSWKLAGDKLYRRLLSKGKQLKAVCCAIFCSTILSAVLLAPAVGDEKHWQILSFLWNKYLDDEMHIIFLIVYIMEAACLGLFISSLVCYSLYSVVHLELQYQLLNAFVCKLHTKSIYHMNDIRYQDRVAVLLICCVRMHTEIKKLTTILMNRSTGLILAFTAYGLTLFVFSAYFIIMEISPRSNFRMYSMIVTSCLILWAFCEYCQRVTNESEKVFLNACRCPWEQFNNTNRLTLLMLLSNSASPVTISCHGILDANYPLAVKMFRMGYAFHTLLTNIS